VRLGYAATPLDLWSEDRSKVVDVARPRNTVMPETEAFHLTSPAEEDLAVAEAAWHSGEARYVMRTNDICWRVLRAQSQADARQFLIKAGHHSPEPR
jgi:hypothetical protein